MRHLVSCQWKILVLLLGSGVRPEPNMLFYRLFFLEMLNFFPIMLKIMPDYASKFCKRVYITILIEQEMTIIEFTRNKK